MFHWLSECPRTAGRSELHLDTRIEPECCLHSVRLSETPRPHSDTGLRQGNKTPPPSHHFLCQRDRAGTTLRRPYIYASSLGTRLEIENI